MKLTKEQRESIEADGLGRQYFDTLTKYKIYQNNKNFNASSLILSYLIQFKMEIKRTIKRIDDEIEFTTIVMPIDDNCNLIDMNCECVTCTKRRSLEQQKQLYELMETLE